VVWSWRIPSGLCRGGAGDDEITGGSSGRFPESLDNFRVAAAEENDGVFRVGRSEGTDGTLTFEGAARPWQGDCVAFAKRAIL
jgi:hypothetical protein